MSTKKQNLYNMAWWKLCELNAEHGRGVTAGEFGKFMGLARSTAKRWLEEMMHEGGCKTELATGKNGLLVQRWIPIGLRAWRENQKYIAESER